VHILWLLECMVKQLVYEPLLIVRSKLQLAIQVSFISFATLGTNKVLSLAVFDQIESINSN
jgi:hypothetical protein